jgi:hypothetical protein
VKTSTERILTTHTGSLPRPSDLTDRHDQQAVRAAVAETVQRQLNAGVDIINDGEVSKTQLFDLRDRAAVRLRRRARSLPAAGP